MANWKDYQNFKINFDKLQNELDRKTENLKSATVIAKALVRKSNMSKLSEVAQRIAAVKKRLSDEADDLMSKLDGIEQKEASAIEGAQSLVNSQASDIDALDAEIRQISNLGTNDD